MLKQMVCSLMAFFVAAIVACDLGNTGELVSSFGIKWG